MMFFEGHLEQALPLLQHAAKIEPDLREPHAFLADLYSAMAKPEKAARERVLAERGKRGEAP
jgi:Tfp pilus assembly protein PilF